MKLRNKLLILFAVCAFFCLLVLSVVFIAQSNKTEVEFGDWQTVTAPTCEETGVEMRVALKDPSIKEYRTIPATGHDWNEWETTTEPTCLVNGVKNRSCNNCENLDIGSIPALGHNWGAWETVLEADCENSGTKTRVCLRDENHTDMQPIPSLGHDYGDWVVTIAPTCTTGGTETRYCRNENKHIEERAVDPYGHKWSPFVTITPATCTEEGEGAYVCSNDASHKITSTINARGHSFGDWVASVPATENEDGVDIRVCRHDSSHTETRVAPAIGSDGLKYTLNSAGTEYSVKYDYPRPSGTVYIPAVHNGLPVTALGSSAFQSCKDIESIVFLGNNLQTIWSNAFAYCEKLESIELPEGVTTICAHPFTRCENLKSVSFPSTVTYMGMNYGDHGSFIGVFRECPKLETITVAEDNAVYKVESGCLIEKESNALITGTKNAVIPNYVTEIKRAAFIGSGIESIHIPASIANIEDSAFNGCLQLKEIIFENGELETLGYSHYSMFSGCVSLEKIELPENITGIYGSAFSGCTSLKEVVFGSNLQIIDAYAFRNCNAIEICEIPASVTQIYATSFMGAAVSAITIDEGNTTYKKDGNCIIEIATNTIVAGADNSVIPDYVTEIGSYAFHGRDIKSIVIPSNVQAIGDYAFAECASLQSVSFNMGSKLEVIGKFAFTKCTSLNSIMLPEKLSEISSNAFSYCTILSSVTFGYSDGMLVYGASSLESIGGAAFAYTALKSFKIPKTVTSIGQNAFWRCENLTSLTVEKENTVYKMVTGCLVEIATRTVVFALDGATLPEETEIIGTDAFANCTNATIVIPAGVEVKQYAFEYWTAEQTIIVKGFASEEEADAAWGSNWRYNCKAVIVYEG
ncbi:MAG: leucine-rich repeat domain-containing protein [Clostridia bacterium]|nr:leucine-rich repeat domain-containing protein [Clostridia bacterium]